MHLNLPGARKAEIAATTKFGEGCFPLTYLGAPIHYKKLLVAMFGPLLDKVKRKIAGWKGKVLLKHALSSIPIYVLSCINTPKKVIDQLHGIFFILFWGEFEGQGKRKWVSWTHICGPIKEGGLV